MNKTNLEMINELKELCRNGPYTLNGVPQFAINIHDDQLYLYRKYKNTAWPVNLEDDRHDLISVVYNDR